ncbi:MAG: 3-deoxy-7-phosphoheptulonate synthase, partial [Eggerthellaceae bacterium]|nr:3-deoxy-7-phosphoheptulonate synthase [Eggerthellaceae bacterium]
MNMDFKRKLPIPMETKEMYPVSEAMACAIEAGRGELKDIFAGQSDKLVLIIGPCSADNEDSVMDYLTRLAGVTEQVADRIRIVPRLYTNKPRTTGEGYKGLAYQPDP